MARFFAAAVTRLRHLVLLGWLVAAAAATFYLPPLASTEELDVGGFIPGDAAALEAEARSREHFDFPILSRVGVVQRRAEGLSTDELEAVVGHAASVTRRDSGDAEVALALPIVNDGAFFPEAGETRTTTVTYLFISASALETQWSLAHEYADGLAAAAPGVVGVTGAAPARYQQWVRIREALPLVAPATGAFVALVFAVAFRSLAAPFLVLAAAAVSYAIAVRAIAWLGATTDVVAPRELEPIVIALLLGIVTDYAVFYLSGVRNRLADGLDRRRATAETARVFTPIIATAGLIVSLGVSTLVVGRLEFFRALGPGLALTVFVTLLVGLTFIPAALAVLGRAAYWPARIRSTEAEPPRAATILARVSANRLGALALAALAVAGLGAAAREVSQLELGLALVEAHSPGTEARAAAEAAERGFGPGIVAPTEVLVEARGVGRRRDELARFQRLLAREPQIAGVVGPTHQPRDVDLAAFVAPDAARFAVVFDHDPFGATAIERLGELEDRIPALLAEARLGEQAEVRLGGDTALARDTITMMSADAKRVAVAALAVNFLLLALFVRALVAPLYLLAASVLSLAAALGLTTYVFQGVLGFQELTYYVPFAVAVLALSLGSDYNLFVAGQIWQQAEKRTLRDAIVRAAPRASRPVIVAGLTLAGSFALLAVIPLRPFRELAFAMAAAVLLDTFVVRPLLVPSLVALFGRASWWPRTAPTARR